MTATRTTTARPSLMTRLRGKNTRNTQTTTKVSKNPLTGAHTTTRTTKETIHPRKAQHTTSASHHTSTRSSHATTTGVTGTHHRRKPSMGDKVSGAVMKIKGSLTKKPGLKAAGTRRMHGTDGKGSHRVY